MKVTWLGQAGLYLQTKQVSILVDPYFTDSAASVACHRKMPVDPIVWNLKPDVLLITHEHIDHYDPETVAHFVHGDSRVTVLSPRSVWDSIRKAKGENNFVCVSSGVIWTAGDVEIRTVSAVHSEPFAVGFVLKTDEKRYYIAGDTLYSRQLAKEIAEPIDVAFLPINGKGNNMNASDAAKLASELDVKLAVPVHFGMLDNLDATIFAYKNKMIPEIYKEMEL
jgi:L-ascorbate metabolism protein UlaG (beta-lactamase superfamily)